MIKWLKVWYSNEKLISCVFSKIYVYINKNIYIIIISRYIYVYALHFLAQGLCALKFLLLDVLRYFLSILFASLTSWWVGYLCSHILKWMNITKTRHSSSWKKYEDFNRCSWDKSNGLKILGVLYKIRVKVCCFRRSKIHKPSHCLHLQRMASVCCGV